MSVTWIYIAIEQHVFWENCGVGGWGRRRGDVAYTVTRERHVNRESPCVSERTTRLNVIGRKIKGLC